MSCITYHLESFLRDEARALAGQGMSLADRSARTHSVSSPKPCGVCGSQRFWRISQRDGKMFQKAICRPCHRKSLAVARAKSGGAAARNKKWESQNKQKALAHRKVETHLKNGNIVKKPCAVCGSPNSQAHHEDYSHALEITWLCPVHHAARHREIDDQLI